MKSSLESILLLNRKISKNLPKRKPQGLITQKKKLKKESEIKIKK